MSLGTCFLPKLLAYSLEERVMPRNEFLKILKEKKLLKKKLSLYSTVVCYIFRVYVCRELCAALQG